MMQNNIHNFRNEVKIEQQSLKAIKGAKILCDSILLSFDIWWTTWDKEYNKTNFYKVEREMPKGQ